MLPGKLQKKPNTLPRAIRPDRPHASRLAPFLLLVALAAVSSSCTALRDRGQELLESALRTVEERVPVLVDTALDKVETRLESQIERLPEVVDSASRALATKIAGEDDSGELTATLAGVLSGLGSAGLLALKGWLRNRKSDERKSQTEAELAATKERLAKLEGATEAA